jgi:hypothetical protein
MTVVGSASGTRIDECGAHTRSTTWAAEELRTQAGFVLHAGRDWCGDCWRRQYDPPGERAGSEDR